MVRGLGEHEGRVIEGGYLPCKKKEINSFAPEWRLRLGRSRPVRLKWRHHEGGENMKWK